jgi:hypothetical protein
MAWTYDTSLPANKDKVRFFAGDTESGAAVTTSDEEIAALLALGGGVKAAAAQLCDHLALRYAQRGQQLTDDIGQSVNYGDLAAQFKDRARVLRSQAAFGGAPFAGGISIADKQAQLDDSDRVRPSFTTTLHEAPGTGEANGLSDQ